MIQGNEVVEGVPEVIFIRLEAFQNCNLLQLHPVSFQRDRMIYVLIISVITLAKLRIALDK